MQSVLVLHSDPKLEPFLARLSSPEITFRDFSLIDCKSEENLVQILPPQVRLVDAVFLDLLSLQILGKWILNWLRTQHADFPVIVRIGPDQLVIAELPANWTFVFHNDPIERVRQVVTAYLIHQQLLKEVQYLKQTVSRRAHAATPAPTRAAAAAEDSHQYREAFLNLSRLLGSSHDLKALCEQVVSLLREMFGVGKLAIFVREREAELIKRQNFGVPQGDCTLVASIGIPREMMKNFTLSLDGGIGRYAATQAKILRRDPLQSDALAPFDTRIQKEFDVTGTEFAVPILDRDATLGILTFGGKVTGEEFTNDELELIFNLMNQLGVMVNNVWLHYDIARQQSFMQDVLAHIESGVVVISSRSKIAALNRRAAELLGLTEAGAIGADVSWLPSQVADLLFESLHSGHIHQHREVLLQKTSRSLSVSTTRFTPKTDDGRAEVGGFAVAVIEDITQLKEQHAHTREIEQQQFILQLASRLSHELKNSLVSISTFAQLLPQQYERKEFRDEFFKIVANEVARVDLLVENLTFFAHPLILRYEEVDLGELIESAMTRLVEEFRRQHGGPVVSTPSGQPTIASATGQPTILNKRFSHTTKKVACDPKRLTLAIHNIMYNAIQSMPQGGRLSLVTDDAKPNGHSEPRIEISVIDTGEGIPLANLEAIFQPFFTTRNVGVGLGLTIAQKIILKHGGHISVESKLGKGTTMVINMPTKAMPVTDDAPVSSSSEQAQARPATKSAGKPLEAVSPRRAN